MKRMTVIYFVVFVLSISCTKKSTYEKLADGIVVHFNSKGNESHLKLQVIEDNIIHVTVASADTFSVAKSLSVVDIKHEDATWELVETENELTLKTNAIQTIVMLATGEVIFKDSTGRVLLQEKKGGGKTFTSILDEGKKAYVIRQEFESPSDEAFYGLGGHQNGQVNYKGQDVELAQHNIVDVIPFLYSSKNYGILWDNYSISHFGDPREYLPLTSLKLFNKVGQEGGLTADYYVGNNIVKSVNENKIDYEFLETVQVDSFPKDVARTGKVVWEGAFSSDVEGSHKFLIYSAGYYKVWLDEKLILDDWRQGWNPWTNKFEVSIKNGEKHKLKIEWMPDGGAYIAVKHLDPISDEEQNRLSLSSDVADEINYYFVRGDNADEVIAGYRQLTGKAPIVPKWAMGFWQSRERYHSQKELIDVVKEYRRRMIPLDNIVLDWQYWEDPKWGSHEFDATRFPDPQGMMDELHKNLHANLMISVWPKFNVGTAHYDELNAKGFLFTRNAQKKRKDWVGIGYESTFYNPFIDEAGKLFWKQIDEKLNRYGIDGWWLDATEPDMHSNLSIDERKLNMSPTGMGSGARFFNAYSLLNSKGIYEGQRKSSPDKSVFILTRSAFAGQQRYGAVTWSGDIVSRWGDFQDQIATGINFSLSGIPYWTMDIGGFAVERRYNNATGETLNEWRELNTRWFQFGAFCPIFRSHGQYPFREIFNISPEGHEAYKSMLYYDKLRYRLMPYIYSLAGNSYFNDYTIMRGLVMDFNADPKVHNIADQYMFGPSLLINPVYVYKVTSRNLYLPEYTGWYDLYTGKYESGGQTLKADAPYGRMPVYVKEGSIIPMGPPLQYTSQKPVDPLTVFVYTGKDGIFNLYEDEGVNYNYEQGKSSTILFTYNEATNTLMIGNREGSFNGMLEKRTIQIVWVKKDRMVNIDATKPDKVISYEGKEVSIGMNKK